MEYWFGCDKVKATEPSAATIVISGDTQGWIVPCGCTANQSGGLPRRATFLQQLRRKADVIYLDAGGAGAGQFALSAGSSCGAIFSGEMLMRISAHNIGGSEIAVGPAALAQLASSTHVPLLSANARLTDQSSIAPAIRIFPFHGKRLAVVGVVSPRFSTAEIVVADPHQAILDVIARHKQEYDSLLILAYLPQEELEHLAATTPEADAIIERPDGSVDRAAPHRADASGIGDEQGKISDSIDSELGRSERMGWRGRGTRKIVR